MLFLLNDWSKTHEATTLAVSCRCTSCRVTPWPLGAGGVPYCLAGLFQDRLGIPASLGLMTLITGMVNTTWKLEQMLIQKLVKCSKIQHEKSVHNNTKKLDFQWMRPYWCVWDRPTTYVPYARVATEGKEHTIAVWALCEFINIFCPLSVEGLPLSCATTHVTWIKLKLNYHSKKNES